jgi:hypothetical protein
VKPIHSDAPYNVIKQGGNDVGLREYTAAVKNMGGERREIHRIGTKTTIVRYYASDGTRFTFRRQNRSSDPGKAKATTTDVHIESADGTVLIKVRYE